MSEQRHPSEPCPISTSGWDEDVDGWEGDLVRVTREIPFLSRGDVTRHLTVQEFADALVAATAGLTETRVDAHNYYDSSRVVVLGLRPPTAEELADRKRMDYLAWVAAKGRYERDRDRFEPTPSDVA